MRLVNVQAKDAQTKESYKFVFGDLIDGAKLVSTRGEALSRILKDVFCGIGFGSFDISVDFLENDVVYNITKIISNGSAERSIKKLDAENKLVQVAGGDGVELYLRTIFGGNVDEIIDRSFIKREDALRFSDNGDLSLFPRINEFISGKADDLEKQINEIPTVNQSDIDHATADVTLKQDVVDKIKSRYADLQNRLAQSPGFGLTKDLTAARDSLKELDSKKNFIDVKRKQLADFDSVSHIVPKLKEMEVLGEQVKDLTRQCDDNSGELAWYESEYASVNNQLGEKQRALYKIIANRVAVQAIEAQLTRSKELAERNVQLNDNLTKLNEQIESMETQKVSLKNSLSSLDDAINEIKGGMDEFTEPDKNFADLVESIRINAKMDELEAQIEKYKAEITVRESQVIEREKLLVTQTKQLRNIMDLDTAVSPYKAREAIMAVIDAKLEKINTINASLKEKMRNLYRAKEGANYSLTGIVQSNDTLSAELTKTRKLKGEEFKRQVLINSQKIYQDATAVYAVENDLDDEDIENLENLLKSRALEKEKVIECVARISGALDEIQRHIDINQAEINNLNAQKDNIINRYNELIHENTNETVSNYLRAIETDKGTNYLLEVSGDTVRTETEIKDVKKSIENTRIRLSEAQNRLKQLADSRTIIDGEQGTMESMMHLNEQTKNELSDVAVRLTNVYSKHKATLDRIEELDMKIMRVKDLAVETIKTIKINEREIEYAENQTEKFAGGGVQKVLEQAKYEEREANAEVTMLIGSKETIESQLFDKKVAFNQLCWLKENKEVEYQTLKEKLRQEFIANNVDAEWVESVADLSDENINNTRQTVIEYDNAVNELRERVKHLAAVVSETAPLDRALTASLKSTQKELNTANKDLDVAQDAKNKLTTIMAAATVAEQKLRDKNNNAPKEVADFLKRASVMYYDMTGLKIRYKGKLTFADADGEIEFSKLERAEKTAAFIALSLAYPNSCRAKSEFVILDDDMANEKLKTLLASQIGCTCVVESRYTKPKENK